MSAIFTPTNQIRLTNIAVVRMKKCGQRFEIACYKNKVVSWRKKIEKDIDEVLQTPTVFTNVSKGQVAKKEELIKCFGTDDQTKVSLEILDKGELQISEKERQAQQEESLKEIASIISDKTVNPETKRPYPVSMIEKAMKQMHFSLKANKSAKQQALDSIPKIKTIIPIEKAQMKLRVLCHKKHRKTLKEMAADIEEETINQDGVLDMIFTADPGHYRAIDSLIKDTPKSQLHVLSLKEVVDGDESIEGGAVASQPSTSKASTEKASTSKPSTSKTSKSNKVDRDSGDSKGE
jgi:ribosome maturation protein SDO1